MSAARALALAGLVTLGGLACHRARPEETDTETAVPVEVAAARRGAVTTHLRATGTVDPAPGADWTVTAPNQARISALPFATGDAVRKGAVLARFDAPPLRADLATRTAELAQARAALDNARQGHERIARLFDKGIAAQREVEDARKTLRDAEAALGQATATRAAAADLAGRATAVAPFDGLVAQRWHNPGDVVDANEHVVRLVDPRRLEVTTSVLLADVGRVTVGRPAHVTMAGRADEGLSARVVGAPAAADPATGTAIVRLRLSAPLPVGAPVQADIEAESAADALLVPAAALVRDEGHTVVYVVGADGRAHRKEVTVGLLTDDDAQILTGLDAGARVIVKGQEDLPDGAAVAVEAPEP